jgi:hypothetical protein
VAVHTPGLDYSLGITLVSRATHMINNGVVTLCFQGIVYLPSNVVQGGFPGYFLPLTGPSLPFPFQGIKNALLIVDLVNGGRAFGTKSPPAGWVVRISLKFPDITGLLVHVSQ